MRNTVAAEEAQLQKKRAPEPAKRQEPTGPSAPNNHPSPHVAQNKEQSEMHGQISEAIVREKPNVKWEDVAGLDQAKKVIQEAVILPMKFPEVFVGERTPWRGILLYGVIFYLHSRQELERPSWPRHVRLNRREEPSSVCQPLTLCPSMLVSRKRLSKPSFRLPAMSDLPSSSSMRSIRSQERGHLMKTKSPVE